MLGYGVRDIVTFGVSSLKQGCDVGRNGVSSISLLAKCHCPKFCSQFRFSERNKSPYKSSIIHTKRCRVNSMISKRT